MTMSRAEIVESVLGSARAEDAEPNAHTLAIGEAWVRGELSDAQLPEAENLAAQGLQYPLPAATRVR